MGILTDDMKTVVTEQRLGFVATVNKDGSPNLSPKATMMVLDDDSIMFADIRSPGTVANLKRNPAAEVNFVDPMSRKGYRFRGKLRLVAPDEEEYDRLHAMLAEWVAGPEDIKAVVVLDIDAAPPLTSPAYDRGTTDEELRNAPRFE